MGVTDRADQAPPPSLMCDVCHYRLFVQSTLLPGVWDCAHPPDLDFDHDPMPAPTTREAIDRCDFCMADQSGWTLICAPFDLSDYRDDGAWSACSICVELVRAGKWNKIVVRVAAHAARQGWPPEALDQTARILDGFRRHFTGEIDRT